MKPTLVRGPVPAPQKTGVLAGPMPMLQMATGGQLPGVPKRLDQALWDTEWMDPATVEQVARYFVSLTYATGPVGAVGVAKTRPETNMDTEGGQLDAPRSFAIKSFQVQMVHDTVSTERATLFAAQRLRANVMLRFLQGSKEIWRMPIEKLPGTGLHSAMNAASGLSVLNLGSIAVTDFHKLGFVIALESGYPFSVELFASTRLGLVDPVRLRVKMRGTMVRSLR